MTRREEHVQERLHLFCRVAEETGSYEDAMWAVLRQEEEERQREVRGHLDARARAIVDAACAVTGVSRNKLLRSARKGDTTTEARYVAMRALRDEGYSLPAIGRALRRHHTSVMYGLTVVARNPEMIRRAQEARECGGWVRAA